MYCKVPVTRDMLSKRRTYNDSAAPAPRPGPSSHVPPAVTPKQNAVGGLQSPEKVDAEVEDLGKAIARSLATYKTDEELRSLRKRTRDFEQTHKISYEDRAVIQAILDSIREMVEHDTAILGDGDDRLALLDEVMRQHDLSKHKYYSEHYPEYSKFVRSALTRSSEPLPRQAPDQVALPANVISVHLSSFALQQLETVGNVSVICSYPAQENEYAPESGPDAVIHIQNKLCRDWYLTNAEGQKVVSWNGVLNVGNFSSGNENLEGDENLEVVFGDTGINTGCCIA
jgi:hypothetical protein